MDDVESRIIAALTPVLGEHMARGAVVSQQKRLGLQQPYSPQDVTKLLAALKAGLNVFLGSQRSAEVIDALKQDLTGNA